MKRDFQLNIEAPSSRYSLKIKQIYQAKSRFVIFVDLAPNPKAIETGSTMLQANVTGIEVGEETVNFPNDFEVITGQPVHWLKKTGEITPLLEEPYECQLSKTFVCVYDEQLVSRTIQQTVGLSIDIPSRGGYQLDIKDIYKTKEGVLAVIVELGPQYRTNPESVISGRSVSIKKTVSVPEATSRLPVAYYLHYHLGSGERMPEWLEEQDHFDLVDYKKLNRIRGAEGSICLFDYMQNVAAMPEGGSHRPQSPLVTFGYLNDRLSKMDISSGTNNSLNLNFK